MSTCCDYILELAAIYLKNDYPPYRLCLADMDACFNKTPAQLAHALEQLNTEGPVEIERNAGLTLDSRQKVFPTVARLRTLPSYQDAETALLESELARLHPT